MSTNLTKTQIITAGLILVTSAFYLMLMMAPDITWINTDSDSGIYIWSTVNWGLSHATGAPVFNALGWLATRGIDSNIVNDSVKIISQNLAGISVIFTATTAFTIYLITRKLWTVLIFLTAGIVVSQSTIIETYAMVTYFAVFLYYLRDNKWLFIIVASLALGIHHLNAMLIAPIMVYRFINMYNKDKSVYLGEIVAIVGLGLIPYIIQWNTAIRPPASWSDKSWSSYYFGQSHLVLGMYPLQIPARIWEGLTIFVGSIGLSFIVVLWIASKSITSKFWKENWLLASLILIPIIHYITNLAPQSYVYLMPSFAFLSILASKIEVPNKIVTMSVASSIALAFFNLFHYNIGVNLDNFSTGSKYPSTSARLFLEELKKLPEGSVIHSDYRGWETVVSWQVPGVKVITGKDSETYDGFDYISMPSYYQYHTKLVPCNEVVAYNNRCRRTD